MNSSYLVLLLLCIARTDGLSLQSKSARTASSSSCLWKLPQRLDEYSSCLTRQQKRHNTRIYAANGDLTTATNSNEGADKVFDVVDTDGSGTIDPEEYSRHLISAGYSPEVIQKSFAQIDSNSDGEISREEFRLALQSIEPEEDGNCPMGYWLNSVKQTCEPLGPVGRLSQKLETFGPFAKVYNKISTLFGVDTKQISKLGVSFVLSYSVLSNLNGAMSLSVAWYMTIKRTGLSPLVPGQWKALLSSYAMIYGAIQLLKPFRVAAAIGMSKLSAEYLDLTQSRLGCSRTVAIGCQYMMGVIMMGVCAFAGISFVSLLTGVPIMGH